MYEPHVCMDVACMHACMHALHIIMCLHIHSFICVLINNTYSHLGIYDGERCRSEHSEETLWELWASMVTTLGKLLGASVTELHIP